MHRRNFIAALAATAPGWSWAQTSQPEPEQPQRPPPIAPANALEHAFLAAFENASLRPAFRREFLLADVALALASREPDAAPRQVALSSDFRACLIFTSGARAREVMGPNAPFAVLNGRRALERLAGANVVININLTPTLVLEPEDVRTYLALPANADAPAAPQVAEPESAGPTE